MRRIVRRFQIALIAFSVISILSVALPSIPRASAEVGVPVEIDNFSGSTFGTRTVSLLPAPETSTTPQGSFSQSNGVGTMNMGGDGNSAAGVDLDYSSPSPVDLTSDGSNNQFLLETNGIIRSNDNVESDLALDVDISVTDSNGRTGSFSTGISSTYAFDLVLNFYCTDNTVCFSGSPNFSSIKDVNILFQFPTNYGGDSATTTYLTNILTTPEGGSIPPPPNPSFDDSYAQQTLAAGTAAQVPVTFTSNGTAVGVTKNPPSTIGLPSSSVGLTTTSSDKLTASVSGGPSSYLISISGMTQNQTITVDIPQGSVSDGWGNQNNDGSFVVDFTLGVPPQITSTDSGAMTVGDAGNIAVDATGTPTPSILESGTLPNGVSFSDNGDGTAALSGTPDNDTGGIYDFTVTASNGVGSDAVQDFTLTVDQAPTVSSDDSTSFSVGQQSSFTVTTTGYPTPSLSDGAAVLPDGVSFTDNGDGTATISGVPSAGTALDSPYDFTISASNSAATTPQSFALTILGTSPPTSTTAPSISATPVDGTSLSGDPGVWFSSESLNYTYQWSDCPTSTYDSTTCTPISTATATSYTPSYLDFGQYLSFAVTATDQESQSTTAVAMSPATVAAPPVPQNLTAPVLTSAPAYKSAVVKIRGSWSSPDPLTFVHQWERCTTDSLSSCVAISGAMNGPTYRPTSADIGDYLTQLVTATDKENQSTTVNTNLIGPVIGPPPPINLTVPSINGNAVVGSKLTATRGTWESPDRLTYAYQWQACTATACTSINGATHSTYTVNKKWKGDTITVNVMATDMTGLPNPAHTQASSDPTSPVQP